MVPIFVSPLHFNLAIFSQNTSSGSVCCNDVMVQLSVETLPFGGIGESGYGSYHGKLGRL